MSVCRSARRVFFYSRGARYGLQVGFVLRRIQQGFYQKIGEYGSNAEKGDRKQDPVLRRDHKGEVCMVGQHQTFICRNIL